MFVRKKYFKMYMAEFIVMQQGVNKPPLPLTKLFSKRELLF